ncbi:nucleotide sugar dehydrogenase [Rapidithrix thailandica]|uniref:Nucleotide sugar dehydrogenase n=1 Tax=Rapidithrix thailandica TaxID=413964 RepID=A0AAW9SEB6_9BACT
MEPLAVNTNPINRLNKITTAILSQKAPLLKDLAMHKSRMAVIGLGNIGLPLALEFANIFSVIGFDIKQYRSELMEMGIDPAGRVKHSTFCHKTIQFTSNPDDLIKAKFYIIAVPPSVTKHRQILDIFTLKSAVALVGRNLKKGDFVIFETSAYPGCIEEQLIPVLESFSQLKLNKDFKVGYSPETMYSEKEQKFEEDVKVVAGSDHESSLVIADVYDMITHKEPHIASGIKVAEAGKIIEKAQKDVNKALINELSRLFDSLGIEKEELFKIMQLKKNIADIRPGLVKEDEDDAESYFVINKAKYLGTPVDILEQSKHAIDHMPQELAKRLERYICQSGKKIAGARILVRGVTNKEDIRDINKSQVVDMILELRKMGAVVEIEDPMAFSIDMQIQYGLTLVEKSQGKYDAIVLGINHQQFQIESQETLLEKCQEGTVLFDLEGTLHNLPPYIIHKTL